MNARDYIIVEDKNPITAKMSSILMLWLYTKLEVKLIMFHTEDVYPEDFQGDWDTIERPGCSILTIDKMIWRGYCTTQTEALLTCAAEFIIWE